MSIVVTILYIIACILLFSLAIAIHEFGHFIVALKLGLKVEAFSIGFGPVIWKKRHRGVEYRISAIPFGGYVSIPDVDPEGTKKLEGSGESTEPSRRIAPWKELLVAFAGPAMNLVLAAVLAVILSLMPGARFGQLAAKIGEVPEGGPAALGGMKPGDIVLAVGGNPVSNWYEMMTEIQIAGARPVVFDVERDGERLQLTITPQKNEKSEAYLIMAISEKNSVGASPWMAYRNPLMQLKYDSMGIFRLLKGLVSPKEMKSTGAALGGPVAIAESIYRTIRHDFCDGLGFLRLLNVNLAIINLLPIPVLDGGLILFALIALIFRRRVPEKIVSKVSVFFMWLLLGLMVLLMFRDAKRSYKIHTMKDSPTLAPSSEQSPAEKDTSVE